MLSATNPVVILTATPGAASYGFSTGVSQQGGNGGNKNRQNRPITDLIYMQSSANYTWLVWRNGDRVLMSRTLKHFEAQLPAGQFVRIHRHCTINTQHIACVERAPLKIE